MRRQVVERISSSLRKAILKGRFQPGDPLPSERDLAERYDVNRSSIREAIRRLEAWGLVRVRHGGATRVSEFFLNAGSGLVPPLFELGTRMDPGILRDLHDIRGMLLGWCAERAARAAQPGAVARLERLAEALAVPDATAAARQELDYDFFQELVALSGNRLLQLFSSVVREVYSRGKDRFEALYAPGVFDPTLHHRAVAAIRRHDEKAAGDAMRTHAASALGTVPGGA